MAKPNLLRHLVLKPRKVLLQPKLVRLWTSARLFVSVCFIEIIEYHGSVLHVCHILLNRLDESARNLQDPSLNLPNWGECVEISVVYPRSANPFASGSVSESIVFWVPVSRNAMGRNLGPAKISGRFAANWWPSNLSKERCNSVNLGENVASSGWKWWN